MNQDLIKSIIYLLVGVSVLLIGMKLMSSGLKKCIGKGIRNFFKKTQNNPLVSMGIGTVVTAGIQSSDATNGMVIGFINAGAMTIYQGLCIMLGAYIGTTVTGILASFSSLPISMYFLLFAFIGTVMMFFNKEIVKNIGEILCGLGLLFFGLAVMKSSFDNETIKSFCQNLFSSINFGPLLFLFGVLFAALVQSSSAVTSIVIAMVGSGALGLGGGLYIVLGATLGTVTNTLLTSLGGDIKGKRTAVDIFFLRMITSVIALVFLCIFEKQFASFFHVFAINGSDELPIAMFTVFYNIIFMPLLLPFLKPSIKVVTKLIKDKGAESLSKCVHYIDDKILVNPDIATMQVKKEIINMYDLAYKNYINSMNFILNEGEQDANEVNKLEDSVDYLNKRITDYLILLSNKVGPSEEKQIGGYFHVVNDIERIGDHAYNFFELHNELDSNDIALSEVAIGELKEFNKVITEMFEISKDIFENNDSSKLDKLNELEDITDNMKKTFYTNHYQRVKDNKCTEDLSPYFSSLLTELERVGDHLTNIAYSVVNPVGDASNN